jgi:thiamine-monophosphate kinase
MKLSDLGEFGFIERVAKYAGSDDPRVICGIGDDCAVIESGRPGEVLLLTTDLLQEGTHFDRATTPPHLLGRKALAASLSDIAAMGGSPLFFTVSISAPPDTPVAWADAVYAGLTERAVASETVLVGGDTAASPGGCALAVTLIGECARDEVVYRRNARPGDAIFVTGYPGESAAGLRLLRARATGLLDPTDLGGEGSADFDRLAARHLDPEPRLSAGRHLAAGRHASAMIDVSDGVAADLMHILESSGVGATLESPALPLTEPLRKTCTRLALDPVALILTGGEDYELLFTAASGLDEKALSRSLDLTVTRIGRVTDRPARLQIRDARGREIRLPEGGFDHFRAGRRPPSDPAPRPRRA